MFLKTSSARIVAIAGIVVIALGFAYYAASHPMDFRVYHYGARGVFDGSRPVYGRASGLGWPMHYRYPPLFLLLFAPFALLPLGFGAAVWLILKALVLVLLVRAMLRRDHVVAGFSPRLLLIILIAPYIIEELRYGNAQFFIFALAAVSLLIARKRPIASAASLALAISIKVWPLFFVPYLAARREWKVVGYALVFTLLLTLLPSFYFGFHANFNLLSQWFHQEFQTQLGESEIWFPNQSLRGTLMRYLTVVDYSQVPDSNYPHVNIAALNPVFVRTIWLGIAGLAYAGLLVIAYRHRGRDEWLDHGLAFCLLILLEPFTQKYALCVLLWPALALGSALDERPRLRILIYIAAGLALIQPLAPGAGAQRLFQVLGLDFLSAALLTAPVALLQARTRSGRIL